MQPFIAEHGLVQYRERGRIVRAPGRCEMCLITSAEIAHYYIVQAEIARMDGLIGYPSGARAGLVLDHCHDHGWIRGWLCSACNIHLGKPGRWSRHESSDFRGYLAQCPDCPRAGSVRDPLRAVRAQFYVPWADDVRRINRAQRARERREARRAVGGAAA